MVEVGDGDFVVLGVDDDDDEDEGDIGNATDVGKSVVRFLRFFPVLGNCMAYAVSSIGPVKRYYSSACTRFWWEIRLHARHNDSITTLTSVSHFAQLFHTLHLAHLRVAATGTPRSGEVSSRPIPLSEPVHVSELAETFTSAAAAVSTVGAISIVGSTSASSTSVSQQQVRMGRLDSCEVCRGRRTSSGAQRVMLSSSNSRGGASWPLYHCYCTISSRSRHRLARSGSKHGVVDGQKAESVVLLGLALEVA